MNIAVNSVYTGRIGQTFEGFEKLDNFNINYAAKLFIDLHIKALQFQNSQPLNIAFNGTQFTIQPVLTWDCNQEVKLTTIQQSESFLAIREQMNVMHQWLSKRLQQLDGMYSFDFDRLTIERNALAPLSINSALEPHERYFDYYTDPTQGTLNPTESVFNGHIEQVSFFTCKDGKEYEIKFTKDTSQIFTMKNGRKVFDIQYTKSHIRKLKSLRRYALTGLVLSASERLAQYGFEVLDYKIEHGTQSFVIKDHLIKLLKIHLLSPTGDAVYYELKHSNEGGVYFHPALPISPKDSKALMEQIEQWNFSGMIRVLRSILKNNSLGFKYVKTIKELKLTKYRSTTFNVRGLALKIKPMRYNGNTAQPLAKQPITLNLNKVSGKYMVTAMDDDGIPFEHKELNLLVDRMEAHGKIIYKANPQHLEFLLRYICGQEYRLIDIDF